MSNIVAVGLALSLIAVGTMTGIFAAFSIAVVPGLNALEPDRATEAMRAGNRAILTPLFMTLFFGAGLLPAATGAGVLTTGHGRAATALFVAAGLYLLGAFIPTVAINVPLNRALDSADDAAQGWQEYAARWLRWNHLRALASALSLLAVGAGIAWR